MAKRGDVNQPGPKSDEPKVVQKVVTGKTARGKKPLGQRFKEIFLSGDVDSVWAYLRDSVLIPAMKDTLTDVVSQGIERMVYGDRREVSSSRPRARHLGGQTNYNRMSTMNRREERGSSHRSRSSSASIEPILTESRTDAEKVVDQIEMFVEEYGHASVADLYNTAGLTPAYTDEKWGWYDVRGFYVQRVSGGFLVCFPKPEPLD